MSRRVYLDNNSTTSIDPRVAAAIEPYIHSRFGNPSNIHSFGRECAEGIETAREQVAAFLGCSPEEVYFTGSGTEADNWAVKGVAWANVGKGRHVICSAIEHNAVLASCRYLESIGYRVTFLGVDRTGLVDPDELRQAIRPDTVLVSIMFVNNEIGTIEPVAEIARICRAAGVVCHTDAVAAAGKIAVDVNQLGVDLLTISGHKLRAPKGVGALYVRRGTPLQPLIHGGHQERGMRAGTENTVGIVGLGFACELLSREWRANAEHERRLRDRLQQGIIERVPDVLVNGHPTQRAPNVLHVSVGYVEGEALLMNLDLEGVAVASGSACSSGSAESSATMTALGIPELFRNSPVRFSLGPENTDEEVDYVIEVFERVVRRLRDISPLWRNRSHQP
ncbi:MAG: cysteine desulfurase family protein [candidate division WOR-3 bacterium]